MKTCRWKLLLFTALLGLLLPTVNGCDDSTQSNDDDDDSSEDGDITDDDDDNDDNDDNNDDTTDDDDDDDTADDDDDTAPEKFVFPQQWLSNSISWSSCDLYEGPTSSTQREAECAVVPMPVNWNDPDGQTIDIKVKRLVQTSGATRLVWVLHGGPGGPGTTGLAFMADYLNQVDPKLDVYLLDHRGTGYSTRMSCPQEADNSPGGFSLTAEELPQCADYLENEWDYPIEYFNVTQASIDVAYLMELTATEGLESFVYGISYGAYWGHRYGQLFPNQAKGVILDSIPPSDPTYLEKYDLYANKNMLKLFAQCADDEFCKSKLGDDPAARAGEILQDFKDGHCSVLTDSYGLTVQYLHYMLFTLGRDVNSRILVPALYYRLARCSDDDVAAFASALSTIFGDGSVSFSDRQYGVSLGNHIVMSELLSDDPMSVEELEVAYEELLVNNYLGTRMMRMIDYWPVYEWDEYVRGWADASVPFLMMNSSFDLQSPIEMAISARDHLTGEHQYFYEIPDSNHGVITQSPVLTPNMPDCGTQIMISYMDNPLVAPDSSCLSDLRPVDFNGEPAYNQYYLGNADAWENAEVTIDCGLPDDFMDRQSDGYLEFLFDGEIAEWQPGPGIVNLAVDDVVYDVDSYAVAADRRTTSDGAEIVVVMGYGGLSQVSSVEFTLNYVETAISVNKMNEIKQSGEHKIVYHPEVGEMFGYTAIVNDKTVDQTRFVKLCPKGVMAYENLEPKLWVCHENNTDFERGEGFEVAGNLPMAYDTDRISEMFGIEDECLCYQDGGDAFDCADWESAGQSAKKNLKTRPMPKMPTNFSRPPLPTYTPQNMPQWRRASGMMIP